MTLPIVERLRFRADIERQKRFEHATAFVIDEAADTIEELVETLKGMMRHSCVAESAPDDKHEGDHEAESNALRVLSRIGGDQ